MQAATGQGGWPITVFLTPDAEPFYFGTYFPPATRQGIPSFRQVHQAWDERRDEVTERREDRPASRRAGDLLR
ncbi:hypothetical protein GCM10017668_45140 [Streptomyces tuirus]|uniref:Spermatogenesis-associated protein 20-like TRX domain-containing protein n=1 Tax=Streptomyces tuirus TaxID=68278 RepID=A0A7G1NIU1_9ACTN|nr:hypothetical protein GCM10017668_45140 [Streptomyces tuirus]